MKDSGIDWIGKIPDEWKIKRLKFVSKNRNEKYDEQYGKLDYFSLENIESQSGHYIETKNEYDISQSLICQKDDVVFGKLRPYLAKVYKVEKISCCSSEFAIFYNFEGDSSFLKYYFLSDGFVKIVDSSTYGIKMPRANIDFIRNMKVTFPSKAEQTKIANFLDKKCAQIDSIIEESKKSIEEYKTWKQSMIFEAVTGKNLSCKKKNSGIEWISEIPETWEVKRLKCIIDSFEKGNGITKEEVFPDGDTFCVRYGEIYSKYDNSFENCFSKTFKDKIPVKKYFSNGDLLFAGTGELVEEIGKCIAYLGNGQCLAGGDIIIAKHKQNAKFLSYVMNSHYVQAQKSCNKAKLKVVHISATEIGNVLLALPPLSEQKSIAKFLDAKCAQIDSLISEKQSLIKDLAEYKKSLIFEAVTGKRRV